MTHDEARFYLDGDAGLRLLRSGNAQTPTDSLIDRLVFPYFKHSRPTN